MKYEVCIDGISRQQWESCARLFTDYSIYQTWPYQQVRGDMDGQDVSRAIVTDEAGNPLTMCQVRIKNIKPLGLKIGYVQWGPLLRRKDNNTICPAEVLQKLREAFIGSHINIFRLAPNIRDDEAGKLVCDIFVQGGFERVASYKPYRTFVLKVDDSLEQIRARLHKSFRRDLKNAEKAGLELKVGTGEEFCRVLEDLYSGLLNKKGFKGLNTEEFTRTQAILSPEEKMSFHLASINNEPAAILLASSLGDTSIVLLAAANDKGLSTGASYLVWYAGAAAANQAGLKTYDLGGIDPSDNPKVCQFKSRLGGPEVFHIGAFEAASSPAVKCIWHIIEKAYKLIKK